MNSQLFQAPSLPELAPLFPDYAIDSFIEQGRSSAVYRATHLPSDQAVALKILSPEAASQTVATTPLSHPNLIEVYDSGVVAQLPFLTMEWIYGRSLEKAYQGRKIAPQEAARITSAILHGLHHAHQNQTLHLDLRPANILIDQQGNVKVGDFGPTTGLYYIERAYAAPEAYGGAGDHRTDCYAAAVILYQLLTGELPSDPCRPPSEICGCDPAYDEILVTALQHHPDNRFPSAEEFASQLEQVATNSSKAAYITKNDFEVIEPIEEIESRSKKGKNVALAFSAMLVLIGAAYALFFFSTSISPKKKESPEEKETPDLAESANNISIAKPSMPLSPKKDEPELVAIKEEKPVSTYDHGAFLKRGRDYCRSKVKPYTTIYRNATIKNISNLENGAYRLLLKKKGVSSPERAELKKEIRSLFKQFKEDLALPSNLQSKTPNELKELEQKEALNELITKATKRQDFLKKGYQSKIEPIFINYTQGIRKQASELFTLGNHYDSDILKKEAEHTENDFSYFISILNGQNPPPIALPVLSAIDSFEFSEDSFATDEEDEGDELFN